MISEFRLEGRRVARPRSPGENEHMTLRITFCFAVVLLFASLVSAQAPKKLLVAFASYRERPKYPTIYFYEHDGVETGTIVGSIDVSGKRSDYRPSLSGDGRFCAFASEVENQTSRILLWDLSKKKLVELPSINDSPNAQLRPSLSGDGKLLAFAAWNRPNASQRWDLFVYDVPGRLMTLTPDLNTQPFDERMPSLSHDGGILAHVSNDKSGAGLTDVRLYDSRTASIMAPPGLNSASSETDPAVSGDGRLIAFVSDRPGGRGGRDIYLYDRQTEKLVQLPGLNSAAHEQTPSLSRDGRYVAFVSERIRGAGERDVFIYDRQSKKLLTTPELNDKSEDIDPAIVLLPQ